MILDVIMMSKNKYVKKYYTAIINPDSSHTPIYQWQLTQLPEHHVSSTRHQLSRTPAAARYL